MTYYFISIDEDYKDSMITPWSFIHFLSGLYFTYTFYYFGVSPINSCIMFNIIHFMYECKDYYVTYELNTETKDRKYHNSFVNSIGDTIFALIGSLITFYLIHNNKIRVNKNIFIISTLVMFISFVCFLLLWLKTNFG